MSKKFPLIRFCLLLALSTVAFAKNDIPPLKKSLKPLYEIGLGVFWAKFPDYPGSDFNHKIALPFPTAILRGKFFRAKRDEGVRGRFLNTKYLEVDLSFDGTLPSRSGKNKRREGMPDLSAVIEFGPRIIFHVLKHTGKNLKGQLDLHLATRYGFSSDIKSWDDRGLQFNPYMSYSLKNIFLEDSLFLLTAGAKWSTRKLMDYYYGVNENFATPSRLKYHAQSGLLEYTVASFIDIPVYKNVHVFLGGIKSYYQNAKNRKSPLLVRDQTLSIVLGVYWMFHKSKALVLD